MFNVIIGVGSCTRRRVISHIEGFAAVIIIYASLAVIRVKFIRAIKLPIVTKLFAHLKCNCYHMSCVRIADVLFYATIFLTEID